MGVSDWIETYTRIWTEHECGREVVERLFTEDAQYRPNIIASVERPYSGHDEIAEYMVRVAPEVHPELFEIGPPIVDGDRVAFELWLCGLLEGRLESEAVCTVLRLAEDGRARDLRDYVQVVHGIERPYDGWP